MKKNRIVTAILTLILFACLIGVEGQYTAPRTDVLGQATPYQTETIGQPMQYPATAGGYQTATATTTTPTAVSQYSQYYTMGAAPNTHVAAPQQVDLTGKIPTTVNFGYQQQAVPFSQYQSDPAFTGSNTLWIQGPSSWIQYATVPMGASLSLLAISPTGGSGYVSELDPNGKTNTYNYYFYPTSSLGFYADSPGRHVVSFAIGGKPSNQLVIDVEGTYTAPSYYKPSSYNYGYGYGYYPSYGDYYGGPSWGLGGFGTSEGFEGMGGEVGEGRGFEGMGGEVGEGGGSEGMGGGEVGEGGGSEGGASGESREGGGDRD